VAGAGHGVVVRLLGAGRRQRPGGQRRELAGAHRALLHAQLALQLVTNQYQAGVVNYLNVLTAQTSALNSERSLLDLRARRLGASVTLIKALGGGWHGLSGSG